MFRELYILRRLNGSRNVVNLLDAVAAGARADGRGFRDLYLVGIHFFKLFFKPPRKVNLFFVRVFD